MTTQINIAQKELNQKLQVCRTLASHASILGNSMDFFEWLDKFTSLQERINVCDDFEEIYNDLQQIEIELLEIIR